MSVIHTHNDYHLGDNLIHLNYLRRLAAKHPEIRFIHAAKAEYLPQLAPLTDELPNLSLNDLKNRVSGSFDSWKNRKDGFYGHPERNNWVSFHLEHFERLSSDMGLESPIKSPRDLLFDYPALLEVSADRGFDFLIINSMPFSGQLPGIHPAQFDRLIGKLMDKGYSIITTAPSNYSIPCTSPHFSVSGIGAISSFCKYIVGVATGPIWPTFNVRNYDTVALRLILLEPERLFLTPNTEHAASVSEAIEILERRDLL